MAGRDDTENMITRTFRFPEYFDEILKEKAEEQNSSINHIVSELIRRYVEFMRFAQDDPIISLSYTSFGEILEDLSEEQMYSAGYRAGERKPKSALLIRGMVPDFESVEYMLNVVLSEHNGWFKYTSYMDQNYVYLTHMLGEKWSSYLEGYIKSMFKTTLDIEVEVEKLGESLIVRFPER